MYASVDSRVGDAAPANRIGTASPGRCLRRASCRHRRSSGRLESTARDMGARDPQLDRNRCVRERCAELTSATGK